MFQSIKKKRQQLPQSNQIKPTPPHIVDSILKMVDKGLNHLKSVIQYNISMQNIIVNLINSRKLITSYQIKSIYKTITQNRANESVFEYQKKSLDSFNFMQDQCVFRAYQRLVEKIISKIVRYQINQNQLSFLHKNIIDLIKIGENISKKGRKLINFQIFIKVMDTLFMQNRKIQDKIFEILMSRGYITSIDEFYTMNGLNTENFDIAEETIKQQEDQDVQDVQERQPNKIQSSSCQNKTKSFNGSFLRSKLGLNQKQRLKKAIENKSKENIIQFKTIVRENQPPAQMEKHIQTFIERVVKNEILNTENQVQPQKTQNQNYFRLVHPMRSSQRIVPNFSTIRKTNRIKSLINIVKKFEGQNPKISFKLLQLIENSTNIKKGDVLHKKNTKKNHQHHKNNLCNFRSSIKKRLLQTTFSSRNDSELGSPQFYNSFFDWMNTFSDINSNDSNTDLQIRKIQFKNQKNKTRNVQSVDRTKKLANAIKKTCIVQNNQKCEIQCKGTTLFKRKYIHNMKNKTFKRSTSNNKIMNKIKQMFVGENYCENSLNINQKQNKQLVQHIINVSFNDYVKEPFTIRFKNSKPQQYHKNKVTLSQKNKQYHNFLCNIGIISHYSNTKHHIYDRKRNLIIQ